MSDLKTYFYGVTATGEIKEGTASNGKPFISFQGELTTGKGRTMKRAATVFNTAKNPDLIERVKTLLAGGNLRAVVAFDKKDEGKGETVRIVGTAAKREAANDDAAPAAEPKKARRRRAA